MHPRLQAQEQQPQEQQSERVQLPQLQSQQRSLEEILNRSRSPEEAPEPEPERRPSPVGVITDQATLRLFVRNVYIYAAIFILITSIFCLVISGTKFSIYPEFPVPYFVFILLAFILMMIMNCFPITRYNFPINWSMSICIQILVIVAVACVMNLFHILFVVGSIIVSIAIVGIFYTFGAIGPQKLLPGYIFVYFVTCICGTIVFVLVVLLSIMRNTVLRVLLAISVLGFALLIMPFNAQYIHGRLEFVVPFDMLHCALTIYVYFAAIVFAIAFFSHSVNLI